MSEYKNTATLKGLARDHMLGQYRPAIGAYILMNAILFSLSFMVRGLLPNGGIGMLLYCVFYVVYFLVVGVYTAGETFLYLNITCGRPARADMIFYGFRANTDKTIAIRAVLLGLNLCVSIPFIICGLVGDLTGKHGTGMYVGLAITGLIMAIGALYIDLLFMPALYLIHDFPDYSAKQVLKCCIRLMKGNMWRLFVLYVSFIPMQLLVLLSLGIGALWVEPYKKATYAEFFLDLMNPGSAEKIQ